MSAKDITTLKNNDIPDVIKVRQNSDPTKTEGKRVRVLLSDMLDTVQSLVETLGSSVSTNLDNLQTAMQENINSLQSGIDRLTTLTTNYNQLAKKSDIPTIDLTPYQLIASAFDGTWNSLKGKPTLPDFAQFILKTDKIPYSSILNPPASFSGNYSDLSGKPDLTKFRLNTDAISYLDLINRPTLFDGTWGNLTGKPVLVTSYTQLTDKPTIPTVNYPVTSVNNKTGDITITKGDIGLGNVSNTADADKPISTAVQTALNNKMNSSSLLTVSKLLWNQNSVFSYTNSTTETNSLIVANGTGTLNIDANPTTGTQFRLTGRGLFNTQTLTPTPTLTIKLYLGNTVIATGSVGSFLLGATNRPLSFYIDILIKDYNKVYAQGSMTYFSTLADALSAAPILNGSGSDVIVDLSIMNQLKMTLTWSVANTNNIIQTKIVALEKLNN